MKLSPRQFEAELEAGKLDLSLIGMSNIGEGACENLRQNSLVVYLEADGAMVSAMYERYLREPKPVIFGEIYGLKPGESRSEALPRCYRELLRVRSELYRLCADIIIPRAIVPKNPAPAQCLDLIRQAL